MSITPARLSLCTDFLDDCYAAHGDRPDFSTTDNVVRTYRSRTSQATYSVMYFAKYVGAWIRMRKLIDARGVNTATDVVSLGAGPQFCLLGWFMEHPPHDGATIVSVDALPWGGVRDFASHQRLMKDVVPAGIESKTSYFPEDAPPQCAELKSATALSASSIPEGATVLLPMVMNHMLGVSQSLTSLNSLRPWFRVLEQRAQTIVLLDMPSSDAPEFWGRVGTLVGLESRPSPIRFTESQKFESCYGSRESTYGLESQRRTGLRFPKFCEVSAAVYADAAWSWLEDDRDVI